MVYVDYSYYTDTYLGNAIAAADFPRLAKRASERVDYLTRQRAAAYFEEHPDPIRDATCAVAEILHEGEAASALAGNALVKSESVGGHSVSYAAPEDSGTQAGQAALNARINAAVAQYLGGTGLLYRGVDSC